MKPIKSMTTNAQYAELFDSLVRVSKGLNKVSSLKEMAAFLQTETSTLFQLTDVWIYITDAKRTGWLNHVAGVGPNAEIMSTIVPHINYNDDPIFKKMLGQRKIFYTEDLLIEPEANKDVTPLLNLRTVVNYPLFVDGKALGVMAFGSFGEQTVILSPTELNYFDVITEQTALTVSRMHFFDKSQQDHLTKLSNRYGLEKKLRNLDDNNSDCDSALCFIYLDLNNFKQINDNFGHLAGDHMLKTFSSYLSKELKSADIIARIGGDEFVLVFSVPEQCDIDDFVHKIIQRIKHHCCTVDYRGNKFQLEFAWGHVAVDSKDYSINDLFNVADIKMYQLKNSQVKVKSARVVKSQKQVAEKA
ncbi:sensor domain-containing diguanylate cyclase [Shewanella sp. 10N.7]|uniref:sensor domain-containing diguanylate cyclase n=1 Tax=Shewanella sp. 10N.7 TaxID=2885093 RepID=UPI001E336742|nr:sensor domain-containing diguanylate cyclase [Shewanella sp. 10N.7]MCC4832495.1 sensor domain-containing diguanylate cyclase [Shewanella sp. 10N.7]